MQLICLSQTTRRTSNMASWGWRTKPRSTIRTVQWFTEFGKLNGKNWNEETPDAESAYDHKKVHPVRRLYTYNAHSDENEAIAKLSIEQYSSGKYDQNEAEGDARNDKATYEFFGFGFVDEKGVIHSTKVGNLILGNNFDSEDFLKQILKMNFPNASYKKSEIGAWHIFPMHVLIQALQKFDSLNRSELILLFGCTKEDMIPQTLTAISKFKAEYQSLQNKQKNIKLLCEKIYTDTYGRLDNKIDSMYDYADAFARALLYTGLFSSHGPGISAKIRIAEHSKLKFRLLAENYVFSYNTWKSESEYWEWFGNPDAICLPWDDSANRKLIIQEKINLIRQLESVSAGVTAQKIQNDLQGITSIFSHTNSDTDTKKLEKQLITYITNVNESNFIHHLAFTEQSRQEILNRFMLILKDDDMSALWLEVNTWKSLLAIQGDKQLKRNFNIEEDLTPKSFAPGIGNTPDMELYAGSYIILPEVSLMTGIRQWEHEGSSVIDHVYKFIKENDDKNVFGLFISSSINIRTKWQFFILNKESWIGKPVPVIPMTITMYSDVIAFIYEHEAPIMDFISLLVNIHHLSLVSANFDSWYNDSEKVINSWKNKIIQSSI